MKTNRLHIYIVGLLLLVAFVSGSKAFAQFEIDPDHFDSPDAGSLPKSKPNAAGKAGKVNFEGRVTLPYTVQCNGQSLPPGKYFVSLNADGRTAHVTLHQKGHAVRFQGIAKPQNRLMRNALVVERTEGLHQLSMIHAGHLDLLLNSGLERKSGVTSGTFERLALISVRSPE